MVKHSSDHDLMMKLILSSTGMDYPYCYSFTIPTIGVTYYSCASTAYSKFMTFLTTFVGENDGRTWSKVYASGSSTPISLPVTGPVVGPDPTTTSISPTITPSSSKKKSTPIGAIIGGVVGGLAIIGLAAAGLVLLLLRRRKTNNVVPATNAGAATAGPALAQGPAPNMTEQQATQSMYGQPAIYQPQQNGSGAGYYNVVKQDNAAGGLLKFGGPQVTQQEIKPPTSPAPSYSHPVPQQNTGISAIGGGPPNVQGSPGMNNHQFQQQPPMEGHPQMMQQNVVQELPAQFATTMHNAQGEPIFEAPDQTYRSA
jgi:hypothetical protein